MYYFFFFFFQAEDGIRDVAVTGVQTCALPISPRRPPAFGMRPVSPELTGQRLGDPEVVGCGDLEVVRRIRNQLHRESGPLADLGIVTWRAAVGGCTELRIGVAQHLPRKALRRLRAPDAL